MQQKVSQLEATLFNRLRSQLLLRVFLLYLTRNVNMYFLGPVCIVSKVSK